MDVEKKLSHLEFLNREYSISHLSYERENEFFRCIKDGDIEGARKLYKFFDDDKLGKLSDDALRNYRYHLIITVALVTRTCIEGGMEMETAYNLSDIYIRSADKCREEADIRMLHRQVIEDFTQRMNLMHKRNPYPKAVTLCLDYIYDNLHTRITLTDLARTADLSPTYLSKLFSKEVGISIKEYITRKRVEAAENMLKYSSYSVLEISDYLCYGTESHFIHVFKKYTGHTPKAYREKFFRVKKNITE